MESMPFRFPMHMTIRCYACGRPFEVLLVDRNPQEFSCPACGKVESFNLGAWEKKAVAWNTKLMNQSRGRS